MYRRFQASQATRAPLSHGMGVTIYIHRLFWRTGLNINSEILRYCRVDRERYLYMGVHVLHN